MKSGACMKPAFFIFGGLSAPAECPSFDEEGMPWEFMESNGFFGSEILTLVIHGAEKQYLVGRS